MHRHRSLRPLASTLFASGVAAVALLTGCAGPEPATLPVIESSAPGIEPAPGTSLPEDWPTDVPTPQGLPLVNAIRLNSPEGPTWSATYQGDGDPDAVYQALSDDLRANGFTLDSGFGEGPIGGVSAWTKGDVRVQLTVLTQDGQAAVNITVLDPP
ncbi:MAG: hypothetical protein V9E98_05210 [Candidatus Nanopelagicales bacterium]